MVSWDIFIVGLVFAVVGVPFIWLAMRVFKRDGAIARWPRAEGVVISTNLASSGHRVTDKNTGLHEHRTMYTPSIRYRYRVAGREHEGKNIARAIDGFAMPHDEASRIANKYPPDAKVSVLYDPSDPTTAYLEVRRSVGAFILLGMGALFGAIGVLVLIVSIDA